MTLTVRAEATRAQADGTPEAAVRLQTVLTNDPGIGVLRHADAGYAEAVETAGAEGLRVPMGILGREPQTEILGSFGSVDHDEGFDYKGQRRRS